MRHAASFLIGCHDQRRQLGTLANGLKFGDIGGDLSDVATAHVAPSEIYASDQSPGGERAQFVEFGVTDDKMGAKRLHDRAGFEYGIVHLPVLDFAKNG